MNEIKHEALARIVDRVGSITELANVIQCSRSHVSNWLYCRRRIPAQKVMDLVYVSGGTVTAGELRPDVFR